MTEDAYRSRLAVQPATHCFSKIASHNEPVTADSNAKTRRWFRVALVFVVITMLFSLLTSQAQADDPPVDDRPIIMCQTTPPYWFEEDGSGRKRLQFCYSIYRELGRQLVLNVFREEFGLPTRDESLFEPIDLESDHLFEIQVKVIASNSFELIIRHKDKQVFSKKLPLKLNPNDAHKCATNIENKIKPDLIAAIEKLGYRKDDRTFERTDEFTPLPDSIKQQLRSMNHIAQYRALRMLHELIRREGPSVSRLCGLVRGYSNLSQLTSSTLDSRTEVFAARAMLYGRRLRRFSKNSVHSVSTDAYSEVMLGYPNRAFGHSKGMAKRFAEKNLEPDDWLPLLDDYIHYRDSKLEAVMNDEDSSLHEVAALLRFRSGLQSELSGSAFIKEQAGRLALEVIPTCQWIYDRLAYRAGISSSHRWTALAPQGLAKQMQEFLPDCEDLPADTKELIDEINADEGFDIYSIAEVANKLIEDAQDDKTEPSLAVLGRNIEAWNVMHVVRLAQFHRNGLAVDPYPALNDLEVVYENHPSAILIRSIGIKSDYSIQNPEYLERVGGSLKDFEYKHPNRMSDYALLHQLHPQFKFANDINPRVACSVSLIANEMPEYNYVREAAVSLGTAYYMKILCSRSPVRMATLFTEDWENNKQDFEQWVKDYSESPATSLTAARVYRKHLKDTKKSAEFYEKYLEKFPDAAVLKELAKMQFSDSESDDWKETLIRVFDTEDLGLQHSNTAAILAANLMKDGDYDAALEWAERSNRSGSGLGMLTLQQCLTGLDELDRASDMGRQNADRYGRHNADAAFNWFYWCGANKHEDLDEAWNALQEAYKATYPEQKAKELIAYNQFYYNLFSGDMKQLVADLEEQVKLTGSVTGGLRLAIYSDQANNSEVRDKMLELIASNEKVKPNLYSALAKMLQKYFKSGKYDHSQVMELFKRFPATETERIDINHHLVVTRLKHEGDELHDKIKRYLAKKTQEGNLDTRRRAMHHLTLVGLGENPVYFLEAVYKTAWTKIEPGEMTEEQEAQEEERQEYLKKRTEQARRNDFQMKRFLEEKAERKKAAEKKAAEKEEATKEKAAAE